MLKLTKVALTGGIASGKSTVLDILKELGATTLNADELIHQILSLNLTIAHQVLNLLGEEVLNEGKLDRKRIANKVFNNPEKLQQLELLLHPTLRQEIRRHYEEALRQIHSTLFVVEIPLFFETGSDPWYDVTVCVDSDEQQCIERFKKKTGLTEKEYRERMQRQLPPEDKRAQAQKCITNHGSLEELRKQVEAFYTRYNSTNY